MRRLVVLASLLAVVVAAALVAQRRPVQPPADPAPLLNLIGDVGRSAAAVPGRASRMSEADEIVVGNNLARTLRERSTPLAAYVTRVGTNVSRGARRRLPYAFHLSADPKMFNAVALPGGHVVVGVGLIALMTSEDELAAVLAHEIEHIDHFHCIDRYQRETAAGGSPAGLILLAPLDILAAGYAKNEELEADAEGTRLAAAAGYAPLAVINLFEAAGRLSARGPTSVRRAGSPIEEALDVPAAALDGYFRSHPPAAERIARIRDVVRADRLNANARPRPLDAVAASASGTEGPR